MKVFGIDFTSRPRGQKPITCAHGLLEGHELRLQRLETFNTLSAFDAFLRKEGPWVAGLDFPFGQAERFIDNIGWPRLWPDYVALVSKLSRPAFRQLLDDYRAPRAPGDKEHQRSGDRTTGAISPQKLYGVPVALMFYEGAPRLLDANVTVPGLHYGDPERCVVEAYPGVLARRVSRHGYKSDTRSKQTVAHQKVRDAIGQWITSDACLQTYRVRVNLGSFAHDVLQDPSGDQLDAVLAAVQAAWFWQRRGEITERLSAQHRLEGWIADPLGLAPEPE